MVQHPHGQVGLPLHGTDWISEWLAGLLRRATVAPLAERLEQVVLGGPRRYTRVQVAERTGVSEDRNVRLWRALGFADVADDDIVFTDADVEAVTLLDGLVSSGVIDPAIEAAVARTAGQALSRLAEWEVALINGYVASRVEDEEGELAEEEVLRFAEMVLPVMEQLHSYIWRRHISALVDRTLAASVEGAESAPLVVGFADLAGYTRLSRTLNEAELAGLIERFESLAAEVIATASGRIVKMLGDEVMFVAADPGAAAAIARGLLDAIEADGELPTLRIGMALGHVLSRFGDVYGPVVNIASRLTSAAKPGVALVDRELAAALEDEPGVKLRRRRAKSVRGYSHLSSWRLTRAPAAPEMPFRPADVAPSVDI
jgi:adenylate cyclase